MSDIVSDQLDQEGSLLRQIVDLLPVGLTLRSQDGRLILCNAAATPNVSSTAQATSSPAGNLLPVRTGVARRAHDIVPLGEISRIEETASDGTAERTLWTSQRSVRIDDEMVVLSASIDITERKSIERELERLAYLDALTGLPNRTSIELHINDLLHRSREGDRFAVAFIDLDNFKHVNDYYGHAIGDALLIEVAKRLSAVIRASDTPARISGDEFVLVLEPVGSLQELSSLVNRVLQDIKRPFYIDNFEIFASASVGVSLFPEHGGTPTTPCTAQRAAPREAPPCSTPTCRRSSAPEWRWSSGCASPSTIASFGALSNRRSTSRVIRWSASKPWCACATRPASSTCPGASSRSRSNSA